MAEDRGPVEAAEVVERLMAEVRASSFTECGIDERSLRDLELSAGVCAGTPEHGGHRRTAGRRFVRGWVFRLTRWYVEPFVLQQRAFNLAAVLHIAALERRIAELEAERRAGDP